MDLSGISSVLAQPVELGVFLFSQFITIGLLIIYFSISGQRRHDATMRAVREMMVRQQTRARQLQQQAQGRSRVQSADLDIDVSSFRSRPTWILWVLAAGASLALGYFALQSYRGYARETARMRSQDPSAVQAKKSTGGLMDWLYGRTGTSAAVDTQVSKANDVPKADPAPAPVAMPSPAPTNVEEPKAVAPSAAAIPASTAVEETAKVVPAETPSPPRAEPELDETDAAGSPASADARPKKRLSRKERAMQRRQAAMAKKRERRAAARSAKRSRSKPRKKAAPREKPSTASPDANTESGLTQKPRRRKINLEMSGDPLG